jgi:hypothetical protein
MERGRFEISGVPGMRESLTLSSHGEPSVSDAAASEHAGFVCNTPNSTPEQLLKEFRKIRNELLVERAAIRRDLEELLEFLATQKKLTRVESSARSLGRGETAEARAILAAQSRSEAHGSRHAELKGAR